MPTSTLPPWGQCLKMDLLPYYGATKEMGCVLQSPSPIIVIYDRDVDEANLHRKVSVTEVKLIIIVILMKIK